MELTGEQLKDAEIQLRRHLPPSQLVYRNLVLINGVSSDPIQVLVDTWPRFPVTVCRPLHVQVCSVFRKRMKLIWRKLYESPLFLSGPGNSLGSLDDSMIRNMIANFPSCCVLDAEQRPVSWILTYESCAMGILDDLLEHRGKGDDKVLISTVAKRFHTQSTAS